MARIYPFQALRYSPQAGPLDHLVTQPYDKISSAMRERYLSLSPYNLARVILPRQESPSDTMDAVYARAADYCSDWIARGILARDDAPAIFPYFQDFTVPDTGERLTRQGFIALGAVEDYSAGIVHRHEQTLAGPKKDRLELLRHTHAHFGQIFMLYPDPAGEIDALLGAAAQAAPVAEVTDEYGARHRMWRITDTAPIQHLMADKKLLIADGHHRYETALAFRNENPQWDAAGRVMMTFVNMYSPGLKILATHRLVNGIDRTQLPEDFLNRAAGDFSVVEIGSLERMRGALERPGGPTVIGAAIGPRLFLLESRRPAQELDVRVLHERLLANLLHIGEEAVRDEKHLRYIRGLEAAVAEAQAGRAQIAFLLRPTSIEQVADTCFSGGLMPQKSTDFYPKLLSGMTIYQL